MSRRFSITETSYYTGITPNVLRDWRRRGIIDSIGIQQDNKRWTFAVSDLVALIVMNRLSDQGLDLLNGEEIARWVGPAICAHFRREQDQIQEDRQLVKMRWWVFYRHIGAQLDARAMETLEALGEQGDAEFFYVIDVKSMLRFIPHDVQQLVRAAAAARTIEREYGGEENE